MNACMNEMNAAQTSTRGWDWVEMGDEVTAPVTLLAHGVVLQLERLVHVSRVFSARQTQQLI